MFPKSNRFRSDVMHSTGPTSKTASQSMREPKEDLLEMDNNPEQGTNSLKKNISIESNRTQFVKRPISMDRKRSGLEKQLLNQRELKRTTSYIPRATSQRSRTPNTDEGKRIERKSETSLKSKDIHESNPTTEAISLKNNTAEVKIKVAQISGENELRKKMDPPKRESITKVNMKYISSRGKVSSVTPTCDSQADENTLEMQYAAKKTTFKQMINEFFDKQNNLQKQYKILQELRKKIMVTTGKIIRPEESIKITDIGPPFELVGDALKNTSEVLAKSKILTFETKIFNDINIDFGDFENTLEAGINEIGDMWINLIPRVINSRKDLMQKIIESKEHDVDTSDFEREQKNLEMAMENAKYFTTLKKDEMISQVKKLYASRETLKEELKTLMDSEGMSKIITQDFLDMEARLKEIDEELTKEKVRTEDLMEKRTFLEEANQAGAEKIVGLERKISEQKNEIESLNNQNKLLKQKEGMNYKNSNSLKAKEIKDLKAKAELLKALENRMTELANDANEQKKSFTARIEELEKDLTQKEEALKIESQTRKSLEGSLAEAEERLRNVREKKKIFAEMVDKTKVIFQNTTASDSTKREEQLWTELEATKIVVKGYQDQINKLADERNKLLLKFQTISEDKSNQNAERLAADLVRKDDMIKTLKEQITQLQKTCEEHSTNYNKLLAQVKEVHEKMDGKNDVATLSRQLGDIKIQKQELQEVVKELTIHNEELETALVQRSLELDQRDRLVKQQCNLLKMRDELTDLVRSKDDAQNQGVKKVMEQSSRWEKKAEKIYKDLEKKANELDDMYKILVEKQKQVEKLTKIVKTMEAQQERAQEQRVRFESKIEDLQRQLLQGKQKTAPVLEN